MSGYNISSICFVSDTIHTYFGSGIEKGVGGAERQQYLIAQQLAERGVNVKVATLEYNNETRVRTYDGIEVWHCIPDKRGLISSPSKLFSLLRSLHRVDADIYYVRGNDFLCIATALYCRLTESKFVYAIANDSNIEPSHLAKKNPIVRYLYISAIKSADAVTVLTPYQQKVLNEEHNVASTVIPCGYDLPPDAELVDHTDREFVLWVGRLDHDQKRPDRYLKIAEHLPDIPFVMVGPPDNDDFGNSYFESVKNKSNSINNLDFVDFVPPEEIYKYFQKASIVLNTSEYEGFGNVFLEAWRYGTPVVTLKYTLHGVINEKKVGIHAESLNEMIEIVADLHCDPKKRQKMGKESRKLVRDRYSIESVVDSYLKIFKHICDG